MKKIMIAAIIPILLMQTGCMSARFTHKSAMGDETALTYMRIGKQNLQGFKGKAPEGWKLQFESSGSQKAKMKDLTAIIVEALEKANESSTTEEGI